MYCSTCGNQIADHLNYCNNCGARIEKNPLIVSNASSPYMGKALAITAMMGFVGFVAVSKIVLDNGGLDIAAKVLILIAYLASLVLIIAMMIGHMWKNSGDIRIKHKEAVTPGDYASLVSFRGVNTAQLDEAREPAISVTEHTTRTLDEIPIGRR